MIGYFIQGRLLQLCPPRLVSRLVSQLQLASTPRQLLLVSSLSEVPSVLTSFCSERQFGRHQSTLSGIFFHSTGAVSQSVRISSRVLEPAAVNCMQLTVPIQCGLEGFSHSGSALKTGRLLLHLQAKSEELHNSRGPAMGSECKQ